MRKIPLTWMLLLPLAFPERAIAAIVSSYDHVFSVRTPAGWQVTPRKQFANAAGLALDLVPPSGHAGNLEFRIIDMSSGERQPDAQKKAKDERKALDEAGADNKPSAVAKIMLGTRPAYTFESGPAKSRWVFTYFVFGKHLYKTVCSTARRSACLQILGTIK